MPVGIAQLSVAVAYDRVNHGLWRGQIDTILARHANDSEFLRWAALKLSMLERALNDRK